MGDYSDAGKAIGRALLVAVAVVLALAIGSGIVIGSRSRADDPVYCDLTMKQWRETHEPGRAKTLREAEMEENRGYADQEWERLRAKERRVKAIQEAPLRQAIATEQLVAELKAWREEQAAMRRDLQELRVELSKIKEAKGGLK